MSESGRNSMVLKMDDLVEIFFVAIRIKKYMIKKKIKKILSWNGGHFPQGVKIVFKLGDRFADHIWGI